MIPGAVPIGPWPATAIRLVLAVLMVLLVARLLASLTLPQGNIARRWLHSLTAPVMVPVAAMTPRVAPEAVVILFAFVWVFVARMILSVVAPGL